ncbi:hypothetical protein BKA66DRAFT_439766 [Pyrenochaeta sp. MPI-SDFR-AT-0127]|nr:hypothetical protein BKA66DRAFT_439766 [Pyrenochaeta sp. MPI-SDFR-AT-0127]
MSETYRQQAFGRPTFIDASASGSSSGRDHFDNMLDAANLYHDQGHFPGAGRVQPLHIPAQDGYPPGHQFAYASHSSSVSLPVRPLSTCRIAFLVPSQPIRSLPVVAIPAVLGCLVSDDAHLVHEHAIRT